MTRRRNGHGSLLDLVDHAIALEDRLCQLEGAAKVSAKGLLEASLGAANVDLDAVLALQSRIDADPEAHPATVHYVARAVRLLTDPVVTISAPLAVNRMLCVAPQFALDNVRAEGVDLRLAWCLGVLIASTKHPGAFGQVDDMDAHYARVEQVRRDLARAHEAIKHAPLDMSRDVVVEPHQNDRHAGFAKITYRIAPAVAVWGPAGHLVDAIRRQRGAAV